MSAPATPSPGGSFTPLKIYAPLPRGRPRLSPRARSSKPAARRPRTIAAKAPGDGGGEQARAGASGTPASAAGRPAPPAATPAATPAPAAVPRAQVPTTYYQGSMSANPTFSFDGKLIFLTGVNNVGQWVLQTESMARATHCFAELTTKFDAFPGPGTVAYFVCQARFATAWRILHETVTGPVWAYMRVLGYSEVPVSRGEGALPPCPSDAYHFAKLAGQRMLIPGTPEQPRREKTRMVAEVRTAQPALYPSEKHFKRGVKWLRDIVDNCVRQGDQEVVEAMNSTPEQASPSAGGGATLPEEEDDAPPSPIQLEDTPASSPNEGVSGSLQGSLAPPSISPPVEATPAETEDAPADLDATPRGVKREREETEAEEQALRDGVSEEQAAGVESEISIESDS